MAAESLPQENLLRELEPTVERLLDRHLSTTKEWFPHQHIPYSRGRDYDPDEPWTPELADLGGVTIDDAARSALIVNLLTEDNLPYYFRTIDRIFGDQGPWGVWSKRWTAEEGRHSMAIYGYLMVTQAVDPIELERSRMQQVSTGQVPEPETPFDGLFYVALQELATRIAHRNTGKLLDDPAGYDVMARVAADENLHYLFYRDLARAAIELDPSGAMMAIERQVVDFEMPGTGIPNFAAHAGAISRAGIYDLVIHHEQILKPVVLGRWAVGTMTGLNHEAEQAQDRLMTRLAKSERVARILVERRTKKTQVEEATEAEEAAGITASE